VSWRVLKSGVLQRAPMADGYGCQTGGSSAWRSSVPDHSSRPRAMPFRFGGCNEGASFLSPASRPRSMLHPRQQHPSQRYGRLPVTALRQVSHHARERERRTAAEWHLGQAVMLAQSSARRTLLSRSGALWSATAHTTAKSAALPGICRLNSTVSCNAIAARPVTAPTRTQ
jgi:hypothetical protein